MSSVEGLAGVENAKRTVGGLGRNRPRNRPIRHGILSSSGVTMAEADGHGLQVEQGNRRTGARVDDNGV